MSKTNCINCGAAKETSDLQCPFCGTKYVDLTTFDIMSCDPIYIQLRGRNGCPVTAKAYVTNRTLSYRSAIDWCVRDADGRLRRPTPIMNIDGSIEFTLYERFETD